MSELGDLLKKARQEKGMSLEDIQEVTKIRKRYLEALEDGDYKVLPGKFYIRAFIKNYAEVVGLDADEVLLYYKDEVPQTEEPITENIPARRPRKMRTASSEKFGKVGFTILMWSFLILIGFVIWYFAIRTEGVPSKEQGGISMTDNADPSTVSPTPGLDTTPTPEPTITPTEVPVTLTLQGNSGKRDTFIVAPAKKQYKLELTASGGDSWIEIYEGKNKANQLYYAIITDGDVLSYDVSDEVYMVIGRAGNVEATIDGVVIEDGDSNKTSKHIILLPEAAMNDDTATVE